VLEQDSVGGEADRLGVLHDHRCSSHMPAMRRGERYPSSEDTQATVENAVFRNVL
jgi:hypothetical protein